MKYLFLLFFAFSLYGQNILGRVDQFDLPELSLYDIKAKIDTGAKTSSVDCFEIIPLKNNYVKFRVIDSNESKSYKYITKPVSRVSNVKSSNGKSQRRYFIYTTIVIYDMTYKLELSLSSRKNMKYPLLIGRELLKQGFIVDVSKENLSYKSKKSY